MGASDNGTTDPRLLSVAESISDGTPVDWNEVHNERPDLTESGVLEELGLLQSIAGFQSNPAPEDVTTQSQNAESPGRDVRTAWGRFRITSQLGHGSFGVVYRAVDPDLQREVALKVMGRVGLAPLDPGRAVHEARLLAKIRHPSVVTVYGAERVGDEVALWMELIEGQTFDELVKRQGPFSAREATLVGLDLCNALAAVHAAGLIHGDVKAHNVMRESGGRTVLMDFGTGKDVKGTPGSTNDLAGTPLYLAPEVFGGREKTKASDVYSLGVLLYYLSTGSYPVKGDTRTHLERQHRAHVEPWRLRDVRPDLPDAFIEAVERALLSAPEQRYQTVGEFEVALRHALSPAPRPPVPNPHWSPLLIAGVVVLVAALAGTAAYRTLLQPSPDAQSTPGAQPALAGASTLSPATGRDTYRIDAALRRVEAGGDVRLQPGAQLAPGDKLFLQVQVSVPAHVYVVDEDDQGESYLLFPLPGQTPANPLSAGQRHQLPGVQNGQPVYWQVTSAGGREHFLIFVSPERLSAFEQMFARLPQPTLDKPVMSARLPGDAVGILRGIGGLVSAPSLPAGQPLRLTTEFSTPLLGTEETASGLWVRQVTFDNPAK